MPNLEPLGHHFAMQFRSMWQCCYNSSVIELLPALIAVFASKSEYQKMISASLAETFSFHSCTERQHIVRTREFSKMFAFPYHLAFAYSAAFLGIPTMDLSGFEHNLKGIHPQQSWLHDWHVQQLVSDISSGRLHQNSTSC
jgi:hypothetical protein